MGHASLSGHDERWLMGAAIRSFLEKIHSPVTAGTEDQTIPVGRPNGIGVDAGVKRHPTRHVSSDVDQPDVTGSFRGPCQRDSAAVRRELRGGGYAIVDGSQRGERRTCTAARD